MFSFVRHPFERLVSAYMDKVVEESRWKPLSNLKSFSEFVEFTLKQNREKNVNIHMQPFVKRCHYCSIPYDVVGRIETFDEDVKYIIIKNRLEDILPLEDTLSLHENKSGEKTKEAKERNSLKLFSELNKKQIHQLYQMYQMDFEMFRYNASAYFMLS